MSALVRFGMCGLTRKVCIECCSLFVFDFTHCHTGVPGVYASGTLAQLSLRPLMSDLIIIKTKVNNKQEVFVTTITQRDNPSLNSHSRLHDPFTATRRSITGKCRETDTIIHLLGQRYRTGPNGMKMKIS